MGTRITNLPAATSIDGTETVMLVQSGITKSANINLTRTPVGTAGGDLTGSYPSPQLANSGVTAGTVGSSSTIPVVTVDAKGRVTGLSSATNTASGTAGGDLVGSFPNPSLAASGVSPGVFGDSGNIPVITVDAKGRIVSSHTVPVSSSAGGTVTSVGIDAGTTGLTVSNSPITASGNIQIGGTLNIANGGTGEDTPQAALAALNGVPQTRTVTAGDGLVGGGALSSDQIISLATSGVTPLSSTTAVLPVLSVDQYGRVTSFTTAALSAASTTGITALTGDVLASGNGSVVAALTTAGMAAVGTYGSGSAIPSITTDGKGRITALTTSQISALTGLTGDVIASGVGSVASALTTTGMATVGTYGSASVIPAITTDGKGRITAITTNAISALTTAQIAGLATTAPAALATTGIVGLSTYAARADHQHVYPTAAQLGAVASTGGTSTNQSLTTPTLSGSTIKGYTEFAQSATPGATFTVDVNSYTQFFITLTSATPLTITLPSPLTGGSFSINIYQPATGTPTTVSWSGAVKWSGGTAPVITATLGKLDIVTFVSDGVNWYGNFVQNFTK